MNNNRNNNRRRGRGNRNQGGVNKDNRIDSRARGNAPQLLDKYKKLAQDAQHNGDRVQQEYYLQFADHYFRVIADNKARQEEARAKRDGDRGQSNDDDGDEDDHDNRRGKNRRARGPRDDNDQQDHGKPKQDRKPRPKRGKEGDEAEAGDNPFAAQGDEGGDKPKKARAPRKKPNGKANGADADDAVAGGDIDASVLPPSISAASEGESVAKAGLKPRRNRKAEDGGDDAAEAANS